MALITTHHLSDTHHYVLYSIRTYVRSYPWKAVEATVCIYYYYIIITNFATAVAVSAVTWSTILRQFTKNYDLFQDTTPKMPALCQHSR